jgi:hypothetical protein
MNSNEECCSCCYLVDVFILVCNLVYRYLQGHSIRESVLIVYVLWLLKLRVLLVLTATFCDVAFPVISS